MHDKMGLHGEGPEAPRSTAMLIKAVCNKHGVENGVLPLHKSFSLSILLTYTRYLQFQASPFPTILIVLLHFLLFGPFPPPLVFLRLLFLLASPLATPPCPRSFLPLFFSICRILFPASPKYFLRFLIRSPEHLRSPVFRRNFYFSLFNFVLLAVHVILIR